MFLYTQGSSLLVALLTVKTSSVLTTSNVTGSRTKMWLDPSDMYNLHQIIISLELYKYRSTDWWWHLYDVWPEQLCALYTRSTRALEDRAVLVMQPSSLKVDLNWSNTELFSTILCCAPCCCAKLLQVVVYFLMQCIFVCTWGPCVTGWWWHCEQSDEDVTSGIVSYHAHYALLCVPVVIMCQAPSLRIVGKCAQLDTIKITVTSNHYHDHDQYRALNVYICCYRLGGGDMPQLTCSSVSRSYTKHTLFCQVSW